MAQASAKHILVETEEECEGLKTEINGGADFSEIAKKHSKCPSGQNGGDLGAFGPGEMVPEFDKVIFNEDIGMTHGPIKTQFGFHLIQITNRE